jgi:hypothetical protein
MHLILSSQMHIFLLDFGFPHLSCFFLGMEPANKETGPRE